MTFLIESTAKVSLVLLAALAAAGLLRGRSAAVRHWVLAFAVVCAALIPVLALALPSWHLGVPPRSSAADDVRVTSSVSASTTFQPVATALQPAAESRRVTTTAPARGTAAAIVAVWLAGAAVSLSVIAVGLVRLRRIRASARRADAGAWVDAIADAAKRQRLRRPLSVWITEHPSLLLTWGHIRPQLFVPAASAAWPPDRIHVVVGHELAHVVRGDWLAQICAELLCAVYWFNPIVWIVCRALRQESERACDDAVLRSGVDPADYASHLVALAGALGAIRPASRPALAMARPSTLEGRISAMLNARLNRRPVTAAARLAIAVALAALTVPIALVAQNRFASFSGSVVDQTNRVLPDATLTLTNPATKAKYEIHSDRTGHFEFVGLPAGDYALTIFQLGFETLHDTIAISGSDVTRTIQLAVGHLQETITMTAGADQKPNPDRDLIRATVRAKADARMEKIRDRCASGDQPADVGGNLAAPLKLLDVKPVYPDALKAAKVGGVVKLDALIGTDGTVRDVKPIGAGNPDLERAAMDAVRQWEFTPTYLNCTAIEVRMQVMASFVGDR